jgi:hypothetical protein
MYCMCRFGGLMILALVVLARGTGSAAPAQSLEYSDRARGFSFSYPAAFGAVSVGTDDGLMNRAAAVRFSVFSSQGIGGEAVVGQGRPSLDVQAAGGLYDDILTGALPAAMRAAVGTALPALTLRNICSEIGRETHIDVASSALTAPQLKNLSELDRTGSVAPKMLRCEVTGDTVTFDKEAAVIAGGPRRRTYGAVRFLSGRYSTFQLIRAGGTPSDDTITQIQRVVMSFRAN